MYDQRKRGGDGKGRAKPAATAAHLIHFRGVSLQKKKDLHDTCYGLHELRASFPNLKRIEWGGVAKKIHKKYIIRK